MIMPGRIDLPTAAVVPTPHHCNRRIAHLDKLGFHILILWPLKRQVWPMGARWLSQFTLMLRLGSEPMGNMICLKHRTTTLKSSINTPSRLRAMRS
jgi:hypothetical protein